MKKKAITVLFVLYISILFAHGVLKPAVESVRIAYTMESVDIKDGKEDNNSRSKAMCDSFFSFVAEPLIVLEFFELQTPMFNRTTNTISDKTSEKVTYSFDGKIWKKFLYSTAYNKEDPINNNQVYLSRDVPSPLDTLEEYYTGKCFFINGFYFFRPKKCTILDALNGKLNYPKIEISRDNDIINLYANTPTNKIEAILDLSLGQPILRKHINTYLNEEGQAYLRIETLFTGSIQIKDTNIIIPNKLVRKLINLLDKNGFTMTVSVSEVEFIPGVKLREKTPEIPSGWTIIDLDKKISYKKGRSPEDILNSIRSIQ